MVKVAWKVINGYGPYGYLQESIRNGDKVVSKHLAYLGHSGPGEMVRPGKLIKHNGLEAVAPEFSHELIKKLKLGPQEKLLGATSQQISTSVKHHKVTHAPDRLLPLGRPKGLAKILGPTERVTPAELALVLDHPDVKGAKPADRLATAIALVQQTKAKPPTAKQVASFAKHPSVLAAPAKDQLKVAAGLATRKAILDLGAGPDKLGAELNEIIAKARDDAQVAAAAKKTGAQSLAATLAAVGDVKKADDLHDMKVGVAKAMIHAPAGTVWALPDGGDIVKESALSFSFSVNGGSPTSASLAIKPFLSDEGQVETFLKSSSQVRPLTATPSLDDAPLTVPGSFTGQVDKLADAPVGTTWTLANGNIIEKVAVDSFENTSQQSTFATPGLLLASFSGPSVAAKFLSTQLAPIEQIKLGRSKPKDILTVTAEAVTTLEQAPVGTTWTFPKTVTGPIAGKDLIKTGPLDFQVASPNAPSVGAIGVMSVFGPAATMNAFLATAKQPTGKGAGAPKITDVPKLSNGKPAISAISIKKLEAAAAKGQISLELAEKEILAKLLAKSKQAAVNNAVTDLTAQIQGQGAIQEGAGESEQGDIVQKVATGEQAIPKQSIPTPAVITAQEQQPNKNWDADLEKVSGKLGSNEGGLYKDKKLQTLYYIKWPGESRAKMEALAARLYGLADVPHADAQVIQFGGKTAIVSEWIPDVKPMKIAEMAQRADIRENFAIDAWLANWDVVGLNADNIVSSQDGNISYRIDPGGSLIFRAQGKVKPYTTSVGELITLKDPGKAPQASQVFANLTDNELKTGAAKLAAISDQDIDEAVDAAGFPNQIPEATFPGGITSYLKNTLRARKKIAGLDVINFKPPKPLTAKDLKKFAKLDDKSLELILANAALLKPTASSTIKRSVHDVIMQNQLGADKAGKALAALAKTYQSSWKSSTTNTDSSVLRWAGAEIRGRGDDEEKALARFWQFIGNPTLKADFDTRRTQLGDDLLAALAVSDEMNTAMVHAQKNPVSLTKTGKTKKAVNMITVHRTWRPDQVKHLGWSGAKAGDKIVFEEPTFFSWSLKGGVFTGVGHGGLRTSAQIPIAQIQITDRLNNTGNHISQEDEVLFCCPVTDMKVTKAP